MTTYLHVRTPSGPSYAGQDANDRAMWGFPLEAAAVSPVIDFEGEIIKRLEDAGLATFITDRSIPDGDTIKSSATFPDGTGPFFRVVNTGGSAPTLERGPTPSTYENLSMTITARGHDSSGTENRLTAIHRELWQITNTELVA